MKKNLQDLSNVELIKEQKEAKSMLSVFLVIILIMIVAGVINTVIKGMNFFTFMPLIFVGMVVNYWSRYDRANKELKSRSLN